MNSSWDIVDYFEKLIASFCGSKYGVAVDSCTNAIFLSLKYLQYKGIKCDTVNVPQRTYVSVPMQIKHAGYKVNFIENKWKGYYCLDPLPVIDSAQQFSKDMYVPGTLFCLSFQSKKTIPIGRGGMILTDSKDAYLWLLANRHDGRNMYVDYGDIQNINSLGYHMYMQPCEAARGIELFYSPKLSTAVGGYLDYPDISLLKCLTE